VALCTVQTICWTWIAAPSSVMSQTAQPDLSSSDRAAMCAHVPMSVRTAFRL
jgi:hypothetical protein